MAHAAPQGGAVAGARPPAAQPAAALAFTPERLLDLCGDPRRVGVAARHHWVADLLDAQQLLLFPLVREAVDVLYPAADEEERIMLACVKCKAYAPSTLDSYVSRLRDFAAFCRDRGLPGLPCTKEHVHLWLLHLGMRGTLAAAAFPQCVSAINSIQQLLGMPAPIAEGDQQHKLLLQGFGKTLLPNAPPAVKRPLPVEYLEAAIEAALAPGCSAEFVRDVAACCVGFACGLRGSTVAALQLQDVQLEPMEQPRLLRVSARVHKTRDPMSAQVADWEFYLSGHPRLQRLLQTFLLLRALVQPCNPEATLFWWPALGGTRSSFTEPAVDAAVRRLVARVAPAGVHADSYSSHSLRVGLASALNALGVPRDNIRLWVRWTSPSMLDLYIRQLPNHDALAMWFGWMLQRPPALRRAA
jgi:site-specific recombinase XerD